MENNNQEIDEPESEVDERQPRDLNPKYNNPKYSKRIKDKLDLLKKDKQAYYEATKDWNQDLLKEGKEVQLKYQEFNLKVYKQPFYTCLYNPFKLKEFAEDFTKFRKELQSTQDNVRLDLGKYMKKPLTTLTISNFENLNLTGTKMVGIKKLLEFWMKVKNVEKNRESVLRARQVKMLEDREALRNNHDVDVEPIMLEQVGVDIEQTAPVEVVAMETEPAAIRLNFEDGKLTRVFDCAEVQEKVVMNLGVREKLAKLQTLENIRKEEERKTKKKYARKNGKNMVVQKKRGRPFKNSNLKRLTMGQKTGNHEKIKKTDVKGHKETENVRADNQTRKRGRAMNPVEMEETANANIGGDSQPLHDGDSQQPSILPDITGGDFQQLIPINDIQSAKGFEDSAATKEYSIDAQKLLKKKNERPEEASTEDCKEVEREEGGRWTSERDVGNSRGKDERRSWEREEHKGGRSRMRDDREERRSWKREGTYDNESDSKRRRSGSREAPCRTHQDVPTSVEAAIKSLQRKVATCVKTRLERYYDGLPDTLPENRKLNDPEEYRKLAKHFSHKMRDSIQESYELYHRTMEGITLTLHDKDQINMEIDVFFEDKKVIEDSSTSSDDN